VFKRNLIHGTPKDFEILEASTSMPPGQLSGDAPSGPNTYGEQILSEDYFRVADPSSTIVGPAMNRRTVFGLQNYK
jgi:hypothetical protein